MAAPVCCTRVIVWACVAVWLLHATQPCAALPESQDQVAVFKSLGLVNASLHCPICGCIKPAPSANFTFTCSPPELNINVTSLMVYSPINGPIPSNISNLWSLTALSMGGTNLTSSIPSELGLLAVLEQLDLSGNKLSSSLPDTMYILTNLTTLSLQRNNLSGTISPFVTQLSMLLHLDLSTNSFVGPELIQSLGGLAHLTYLNISDNKHGASSGFSGSLPEDLGKLTNLQVLDVSNNSVSGSVSLVQSLDSLAYFDIRGTNITGTLPENLKNLTSFFFDNATGGLGCPSGDVWLVSGVDFNDTCNSTFSPYCQYCKCSCPGPGLSAGAIAGIVIGSVVFVALLLVFLLYYVRPRIMSDGVAVQGVRKLSTKELDAATKGFSQVIGKGGFGEVYYGVLDTEEAIAVKRMLASRADSKKSGLDNEIQILSSLRHRNLVSLLGYCWNDKSTPADLLLVFEFVPNGSLTDLLRKEPKSVDAEAEVTLTWERRLKIATTAAQGLYYLHAGVQPAIIHRDIKSGNILVDDTFEAKVADFGLSKAIPEDDEAVNATALKGTPGYMDPEYIRNSQPTAKSDVYSFGIVLLELATGWQPVEDQHIVKKVSKAVEAEGYLSVVAPSLLIEAAAATQAEQEEGAPLMAGLRFDEAVFEKLVKLGLWCAARKSADRPDMTAVAKALTELMEGTTEGTTELPVVPLAYEEEEYMPVGAGGSSTATVSFHMTSGLVPR